MSLQGGNMALYFGAYFTFGKRVMSALDNDHFNAMVKDPELVIKYLQPHSDAIFENFHKQIDKRAERIQNVILKESYRLEEKKLDLNILLFKWMINRGFEEGIDILQGVYDAGKTTAGKETGQDDYQDYLAGKSGAGTQDKPQSQINRERKARAKADADIKARSLAEEKRRKLYRESIPQNNAERTAALLAQQQLSKHKVSISARYYSKTLGWRNILAIKGTYTKRQWEIVLKSYQKQLATAKLNRRQPAQADYLTNIIQQLQSEIRKM